MSSERNLATLIICLLVLAYGSLLSAAQVTSPAQEPPSRGTESPGRNLQAGGLARSHSLEGDRTGGIARSDIPTDEAPLSRECANRCASGARSSS